MSLQNTFIKNTFENGMWMDSYNSYQPQGTYRYGRNGIAESDEYTSSAENGTFVTNEQALKHILDLPSRPLGHGLVASRDWVIYIFKDEIGYVDLNTQKYKTIYNGACFNPSDCEYITPKFIFRYGCNELLMYWSSNCIYYKMNIDEMLDPKRANSFCNQCNEPGDECCSYFELMKDVSIPSIVVERYKGGGSGAPSGSYSFMAQCRDQNGNTSNWFAPSKPTALVGENGVVGEPSKQTLKVHIKNLDPSYSKIKVGVMANIGGVKSWHDLGDYPYNTQGVTVHFAGDLEKSAIPPTTLFVPEKKYLRGRKLEIKDNMLHLYQIRQEKSPNIFKYSSQITPKWVAYAINAEEAEDYMSMERNERYLPAIVYNYTDGTHTAAGPIFPGAGVAGVEALTNYNKQNHYSFWEDENAQGIFQNVNKGSIDDNSRASSHGDIPYVGNESEETTGTAPSPGNGSNAYSATFGRNKKILENKDINNNFLDKDAYDEGVEVEKESLAKRLADFQSKAPDVYSKECECTECGKGSCYDALQLWESQDKNIGDYETNTAWNTKNKINPDPTKHPDIESNAQVTGSAKGAGQNIFNNAKNAKDKEYLGRTLNITGKTSQAGIASKGANDKSRDRGSLKEIGAPVEIARGNVKVFESEVPIPGIKGCDGQPLYGGLACEKTRLCQMPGGDEIPIVVSAQDGTISRYQMENKEWGDTHVILLGMAFENIPIPDDEDLPKPLNRTNPFSIVYIERDAANTSIIAKGLATGMFEGNVQGKTYLFGRHGINSGEFIDRSISDGADQKRIGSGASNSGFLFHSPTTDILGPVLDVSKVLTENSVSGSGNRLGLYAETNTHGKFWEPLIDNRGYRANINMNHYNGGGGEVDVTGSSYVPADSVVTPVGGLSTPICNRYRERSVFVAANLDIPLDASFQGDTVDHYCPITNCNTPYVALAREMPNQYGSVEGATYIQLGIEGINADIDHEKKIASVAGTCGDVYISFYTKRRTSYISDKNGNDLTPDTDIFNSLRLNLGMADFWKLPDDGNAIGEDVSDPKSLAGTQGPKRCSPGEITSSQYDVYLPSVAKHLIMFWCESRVQSNWRAVGDEDLGEVAYPRLKTLEFDSDTPKQQSWEDCWMNRFYAEHIRPSQGQLIARIIVRFMVVYFMMNFFILSDASNINSTMDIATLIAKSGAVAAFLPLVQRLLFNNRMINRMLGIKEWYVDDSEGNLDEYIKQFEDIYGEYDLTLSSTFNGKVYFGMDEYYYTCECDECSLGETTNEIYVSNKQLQGQSIDNFSRFQANSYLDIPSRYGKLQRLFSVGNGFFAHTTDTILTLRYDQNAQSNYGLGVQLYAEPLSYSEGIPEGNWGTIDPNAGIETKWGYFFVDREHRSINLFDGQQSHEISATGLKNFWKENIDFCEGGCVDQKHGIFYTMGVDHRHNRLLITKNVNNGDQSFTLSFDLNRQVWRFFHDYIPNVYNWNRKRMYSISENRMYVHDDNKGKYLNVYDEEVPFEIEFNSTSPNFFEYKSTMIDTEANIPFEGRSMLYNQKSTFNKVIVFNRTQCTGLINLQILDSPDMDDYNIKDPANAVMVKSGEEWRFDQVEDFLIDKTKPIFKGKECSVFTTLNEGNIDQGIHATDGDWEHQILADKNVAYRFTYDNADSQNHQLYLRQVITYINLPKQ